MNLWYVVGIFVAIALVGLYLWWHGRHTKTMQDKPQPRKDK